MIQIIGFAAALIGSFAFFPQVLKTWRSRSTEDLSLATLTALTVAAALWVIYGVGIASLPVVAGNLVTLTFAVTLVVLKVRGS